MFLRSVENRCASCSPAGKGAPEVQSRLGPETNSCQYCGVATAREWAHFREIERRAFFFSDDLLWILKIFPWIGLLVASLLDRHGTIKWIGLLWGFLAGLPWLAIAWYWKIVEIKKSLGRCPPDETSGLGQKALLPWKRDFG